jgi:hypothetical protein
MRHSRQVAWSALVLALAACGSSKSAKDIAESQRATAEPILAQVATIGQAARTQAPITGDGIHLPTGVKLDFIPYDNPAFNAGIAYPAELADPCAGAVSWDANPMRPDRDRSMRPPLGDANWLRVTSCLLAGKSQGEGSDLAAEAFAHLAKIQYLLVIRPTEARRPEVAGMTQAELDEYTRSGKLPPDRETFSGGRFAGDALLYELATAKLLGGFAFAYESADKVEVVSDDQSEVAYALLSDARFGIVETLGKLTPGTNIRP